MPLSPRSLELLLALGGLDNQGRLTELGTSMSRLPVEPMYGRVLLASAEMGCSIEAMQVGARGGLGGRHVCMRMDTVVWFWLGLFWAASG